jgi:hypothetical protein
MRARRAGSSSEDVPDGLVGTVSAGLGIALADAERDFC